MFEWFWTIFSLRAPEKEKISEGVEGCLQRFFSRKGGGGCLLRFFSRGGGVAYRGFFPGGLSKIGGLLIKKTGSLLSRLSVISLLPVFKTSISWENEYSQEIIIFISIVSHLALLWYRGLEQLGNGPLSSSNCVASFLVSKHTLSVSFSW